MDNPEEYCRDYVLREGIILNQEQFDSAYLAFSRYCITNYDSAKSRCAEFFGTNKVGRQDGSKRMRYYYTCRICNAEYTTDKKKWQGHIRTHFTEQHPVLLDVINQLMLIT